MLLRILGHKFHYECENLCRVFFPDRDLKRVSDESGSDTEIVETRLTETADGLLLRAVVSLPERTETRETTVTCPADSRDCEYALIVQLFEALKAVTGYTPDWGILTGVRPSKLMLRQIDTLGTAGAHDFFTDEMFVSEEKTALTMAVAKRETAIIQSSTDASFSLYVSIPFCPSRCHYCSFVSHSITSPNAKKLIPAYVRQLCEELRMTGKIAAELGLKLESIYFGGGTPTALDADALDTLCGTVAACFSVKDAREYTVEAGRPDTITREKLKVLRRHGVDRVSINPQTLNDDVLAAVGRKHTAQQTLDAFALARDVGFPCINTDLIAGLQGETAESFFHTLDTLLELLPENITVHTLARKRSATLVTDGQAMLTDAETVAAMLSYAQRRLTESGYDPYYMYRQRNCVGNYENVGWCRPGFEGLYNVFMMEECHTVLAVGAGAVTKLCRPAENRIERIFNFKYPYEYIDRFPELAARKAGIPDFYHT